MHNTTSRAYTLTLDNLIGILQCVTCVNDKGQVQLFGELDLASKHPLLNILWRCHPVIIQPNLAQSQHFGVTKLVQQIGFHSLIISPSLSRMPTDRSIKLIIAVSQLQGAFNGWSVKTDNIYFTDAHFCSQLQLLCLSTSKFFHI